MSQKFLLVIIGMFVIMTVLVLIEKQYAKACYWAGAVLLNIGVYFMK